MHGGFVSNTRHINPGFSSPPPSLSPVKREGILCGKSRGDLGHQDGEEDGNEDQNSSYQLLVLMKVKWWYRLWLIHG